MAGVVVVGVGDLDLAAADEGVVNGFGVGGAGGERGRMSWTWTWASVVVIGASASAVISDYLCGWVQRRRSSNWIVNTNLVR